MGESSFRTQIAEIQLGKDGIGRVKFLPDIVVTIDKLKGHFDECIRISSGKSVPVLADIRQLKHMDRKAMYFFASPEVADFTKACATLVTMPVNSYIGNFFLKFNKPHYPIRIFTSEPKAIDWLKQYVA